MSKWLVFVCLLLLFDGSDFSSGYSEMRSNESCFVRLLCRSIFRFSFALFSLGQGDAFGVLCPLSMETESGEMVEKTHPACSNGNSFHELLNAIDELIRTWIGIVPRVCRTLTSRRIKRRYLRQRCQTQRNRRISSF